MDQKREYAYRLFTIVPATGLFEVCNMLADRLSVDREKALIELSRIYVELNDEYWKSRKDK